MLKFFFVFTFAAVGVYLLLLAATAVFARKLLFPAPSPSYSADSCFFIPLPDGSKIAARYLPCEGAKQCVVYVHGNREDLGRIADTLEIYRRNGFAVLAYDYAGYGRGNAEANVENFLASADATLAYAVSNLGWRPQDICAVGYSLGGAGAVRIAEREPNIRALVLVGAFADAPLAVLPFNPIPWTIIENSSKLAAYKNPVLIIHGTKDFTVPLRNAEINFAAANEPKKIVRLPDIGHRGLPLRDEYWREIVPLLKTGNFAEN